jgi:hypothetical protein
MAVALRVLAHRQQGFQLGSRRQLRLARPELDWLQRQAAPPGPVTLPAMRPQQREMSMQRANSLALEEQMDSQVKLQTPLWPVKLPAQASRLAREKPIRLELAQAKCPG